MNLPVINWQLNIKVTNDHLDKKSQDVTDLKQSLEFTQDQMKEEINKIITRPNGRRNK